MPAFNSKGLRIVATTLLIITAGLPAVVAHQRDQSEERSKQASTAKLEPLDVKTGLWETTASYSMAGELPVSPEMMKRLTPEQRARMEQAMKAESGNARTRTYKNCVKKENLDNPDFLDKKQCTWTTLESTSTKVRGSASCEDPQSGMNISGSGEFLVVDREHVKGNMRMKATGGGREMNTNTVFTSKWLQSDCGSVD